MNYAVTLIMDVEYGIEEFYTCTNFGNTVKEAIDNIIEKEVAEDPDNEELTHESYKETIIDGGSEIIIIDLKTLKSESIRKDIYEYPKGWVINPKWTELFK